MQNARPHFRPSVKSALAVLLVGLVLLLNALEASEPLHKLFHHDADQPGHECAITLFAHGHVESTVSDLPVVAPVVWTETSLPVESPSFSTAIENLPDGRAPPVVASPQV